MFIALRRFTLLFTILLERFWLKKSHDWPTLSAMGIMIGGAPGCCPSRLPLSSKALVGSAATQPRQPCRCSGSGLQHSRRSRCSPRILPLSPRQVH